jgi:hypothetical protein
MTSFTPVLRPASNVVCIGECGRGGKRRSNLDCAAEVSCFGMDFGCLEFQGTFLGLLGAVELGLRQGTRTCFQEWGIIFEDLYLGKARWRVGNCLGLL